MTKPKLTKEDKIEAIDVEIKLIKNYAIQYVPLDADGVWWSLKQRVHKLEKERDRLLNPKLPKRTPKPPKTATTVTGITKAAKLKGRG